MQSQIHEIQSFMTVINNVELAISCQLSTQK